MIRYISGLIAQRIITLFFIALITFSLMHAVPGGPFAARAGDRLVSPEFIQQQRDFYGLDDPIPQQFGTWLWHMVQGDMGLSFTQLGRSVEDILLDGLKPSAILGGMAFAIVMGIGIPLGVISAIRANTRFDYASVGISTIFGAVPSFILAFLLLLIFTVWLDVFHRAAQLREREAQIALHHMPEPGAELLRDRIIEPVEVPLLLDELGRDEPVAGPGREGTAGHGVHQGERDQRDEEERNDALRDQPADISNQPAPALRAITNPLPAPHRRGECPHAADTLLSSSDPGGPSRRSCRRYTSGSGSRRRESLIPPRSSAAPARTASPRSPAHGSSAS